MDAAHRAEIESIVGFWREAGPERWFAADPAFDAAFALVPEALALVLLLDQFPRNAFRGSGHMYATDGLARAHARAAIEVGQDAAIDMPLRLFLYLPFAHSEDAADQALSVRLHRGLGNAWEEHALGHQAIIARFGRFPHRNPMLGRNTTEAERAFLAQGGFSG